MGEPKTPLQGATIQTCILSARQTMTAEEIDAIPDRLRGKPPTSSEPKFCRRCHQPVRPSEPQVDTGNGEVEHLHCYQGVQRTPPPKPAQLGNTMGALLSAMLADAPPASPSPEPDAPHRYGTDDILKAIELTLEGLDDLGKTVRVTGIEASAAGKLGAARAHLETAQRYLQAHPTQASAHDLQAANAELQARVSEVLADRDTFAKKATTDLHKLRARAEKAEAAYKNVCDRIRIAIRERDELDSKLLEAWKTINAAGGVREVIERERDEARAERDELRKDRDYWRDTQDAAAEVAYLTAALAEMREACARVADEGPELWWWIARRIRAVPLPATTEEEKP